MAESVYDQYKNPKFKKTKDDAAKRKKKEIVQTIPTKRMPKGPTSKSTSRFWNC